MRFPDSLVRLDTIHTLEQDLQTLGLDVIFDLSSTQFMSPIGAVWCLLSTDTLLRQQRTLKIIPPQIIDPVSWLERFNFFQMAPSPWCESFEILHDISRLQARRRNDMSSHLVEIQRIHNSDSVHSLCILVEQVLLKHGRPITNRINAIVTELANNIVDHSHSDGYAAVQYYPRRKQIEIAIGDSGIGVARSLNRMYDAESRANLVKKAFEDRVSTLVNEDRGYGLGEVRTRATERSQQYEFRMLTNGGVYRIFDDRIEEEIDGEHVPYGTYYEIKIWE